MPGVRLQRGAVEAEPGPLVLGHGTDRLVEADARGVPVEHPPLEPLASLRDPIKKGLTCRCPRCGRAKLFQGFLTLKPRCEACGLDYSFVDAGDGPAVFVILLAGFIVVFSALLVEFRYEPPFWVHALLWIPAHSPHHDRAAASDERTDDRAAISPPGGRGPALRRRRAVNVASEHPRRPGLAIPCLFTLAAFFTFISLGTWQVERKTWKEGLIATLDERLAAQPIPLPLPAQWDALDPERDEFRRVTLDAPLAPGEEALVYTSGSAFRSDVSGPGYWVFTPVRLPGAGVVIVNRGFVPEGRQDPSSRPGGVTAGPLVGVLRWPETPGWFAPNAEPGRNLWFVRDHLAIATEKGWGGRDRGGEVAPFYIDLESPQPPGGLPRPGPLTVKLRNDHLQYAITWFGLAAVVVIGFGFWVRSRGREVV